MDDKTLAKLAILAEKDPAIAEQLTKQAEAISDEELDQVTGGIRIGLTRLNDLRQKNNPSLYRD
jgi:bacteriocin-like protein